MKLIDFLSSNVKKEFEDTMAECKNANYNFDPNNDLFQMFAVNVMLARKVEALKEEIRELRKEQKSAEERLDDAWFENDA